MKRVYIGERSRGLSVGRAPTATATASSATATATATEINMEPDNNNNGKDLKPFHRTPAKGKGLDPEASKRGREERHVQVRKDRRIEKIGIKRVSGRVDDEETDSSIVPDEADGKAPGGGPAAIGAPGSTDRVLSMIPEKIEMMMSDFYDQQFAGVTYFRRILAVDKNPPLDIVLAEPLVVPRMVEFLSRHDVPLLQLEAAWSLTNIACGESRHVAVIVQHGAIQGLVAVLESTDDITLREQAMWALCNISSDENACHALLTLIPDLLTIILGLVGITALPLQSALMLSPPPQVMALM